MSFTLVTIRRAFSSASVLCPTLLTTTAAVVAEVPPSANVPMIVAGTDTKADFALKSKPH